MDILEERSDGWKPDPGTPGYEDHHYGWSQNTFGGHLACTSISTIMACAMADDQLVSKFNIQDEDKMGFLTEFGSGLWKENAGGFIDEDAEGVVRNHTFFDNGKNYKHESYQGFWGNVSNEGGRITLPNMIKAIRAEHNKHGSVGCVFTDNIVSFSCGITVSGGVKWVLFDSHAPGANWRTVPLEDEHYVVTSIKQFATKRNTYFDCTVFWRDY